MLACAPLRDRAPAASPAQVVGRVSMPSDGAASEAAAVFLERIDEEPSGDALPAVVVGQQRGRFEPEFAVVAVGQPVLFVNRDEIFHGVFSYSRPNPFECRPFAPGDTCMVSFREPGVVHTFSPLVADMRGVVLVVPERYYAVPDARGNFRIDGVPAGRYRASIWTARRGGASREISLASGATARADFTLPSP